MRVRPGRARPRSCPFGRSDPPRHRRGTCCGVTDGRVLVSDFGLALLRPHLPTRSSGLNESDDDDEAIVATPGGAAGTPDEQAPEDHPARGRRPRDQYALCVSILRPWRPSCRTSRRCAPPDPRIAGAPRWLTRAIARGVDPDPDGAPSRHRGALAGVDASSPSHRIRSLVALPLAIVGLGTATGSEQRDRRCGRHHDAVVACRAGVGSGSSRGAAGAPARDHGYRRVCGGLARRTRQRAGQTALMSVSTPAVLTCLERRRHNLAAAVELPQDPATRPHAEDLFRTSTRSHRVASTSLTPRDAPDPDQGAAVAAFRAIDDAALHPRRRTSTPR